MDLLDLPPEIQIEILLFAAYKSVEFARNLALVSSWANKLAQRALFSTVSVIRPSLLRCLFRTLRLVKGPFPRHLPAGDFFRLSFKQIPELRPTDEARQRASLLINLWLIPVGAHMRQESIEDHTYTRLTLQLCTNIQSLALTGTAFSHFLVNKFEHFRALSDADGDEIQQSPYPYLTHLTLLDSTPSLIMERHYKRAEEYVRIFKQLTHFTTYGYYHRNGIPVPIEHFPSLTHVALPLILAPAGRDEVDGSRLTTEELYHMTGGWKLLQSTKQIRMVVFLFPSNGHIRFGSHLSEQYIYHPPVNLILEANRLDERAYALTIDGLGDLQRRWHDESRGGPSMWDFAKSKLASYHRAFGQYGI